VAYPATSGVFIETGDAATLWGTSVELKREGVLGLDPCSYWGFNEGSGLIAVDQGSEKADITVQYGDTPPVAYWRFNDGAGTILADEMGAYNGTLTNGPTWVTDGGVTATAGDHAIDFDGTNDYVNLGQDLFNSDMQGSVSAWIYWDSSSSNGGYIFCAASSSISDEIIGIFVHTDDKIYVMDRNGFDQVKTDALVSHDVWHHVVVTADGSQWKVYLDGVLQALTVSAGSNTGAWLSAAPVNNYSIGNLRRSTGDIGHWTGKMDEVAVFNEALEIPQIEAIYNTGSPPDLTDGSFAENILGGAWASHYVAFDGNDRAFNGHSNAGIGSSSFAMSVWVRISGDTGGAFIKVGAGDGVALGIGDNNVISGTFDGDGKQLIVIYEAARWIRTGVFLGTATWNHVVLNVNSSGHPTLFLNGTQIYTDALGGPSAPSAMIGIGGYPWSSGPSTSRRVAADIDDVGLFCNELISADIQYLYGLGPSYAGFAYSETPGDGISLSETLTFTVITNIYKTITDGITTSEDDIYSVDSKMTPDGMVISEDVDFVKSKTIFGGLSLGETFTLSLSFARYAQDVVKLADVQSLPGIFIRRPIDGLKMSEEFEKDTLSRISRETIVLSETFSKIIMGYNDTLKYTGSIEDVIELKGTII